MLSAYPKKRTPLPPEYQEIYTKHYLENRQGSTSATNLSSRMESWMHKKVAQDLTNPSSSLHTLEIGAGNLNHLSYEKHTENYDVVEPFDDLIQSSSSKENIRHLYSAISEISNEEQYDRIISIAVLEHLENLPDVIARAGLLLKKEGSFRAGIPNEGTPLWTLAYKLTTGVEFRFRYKLDYNVIMQHEHVNTADEIETVLKYFFSDVNCEVYGIAKDVAFYRFYECRQPDKDKCQTYLNNA